MEVLSIKTLPDNGNTIKIIKKLLIFFFQTLEIGFFERLLQVGVLRVSEVLQCFMDRIQIKLINNEYGYEALVLMFDLELTKFEFFLCKKC